MMRILLISVILCFVSLPAHAQIDAYTMGARAWGLGGTTATLQDVWAVGNNPAGMASVKKMGLGLSYHSSPILVSNFNVFNLAYVQNLKKGVIGLQVSRFGDKIYSETKAGLAYAYSFNKLHLALKTNFVQIAQSTLGSQARLTFEFGAQVPLNKYLKFGAHVYNFTQSAFEDMAGTRYDIPTTIKLGLAYEPIKSLSMFAEASITLQTPVSPRLGVEYALHKNVSIRTGLQAQGKSQNQTQTFSQFGGLGLLFKKIRFDYALASQSGVGVGHHMGLSFLVE